MKPLPETFSMNRRCDCNTRINNRNRSGRCKRCNLRRLHNDPEIRARIAATERRRCQEEPLFRAKKAAQMRANHAAALLDPDKRARIVAAALRNIPHAFTPEALEKKAARQPEANRKLSERKMAWCKPEYRADYHMLIRKHYTSAEARAMILAQIADDLAKLSPFERQERALAKGAKLVANDSGPAFGEAIDYGEARWTA